MIVMRPLFFQKLSGVFAAYKSKGVTSAELCNTIRDQIHKELSVDLPDGIRLKIGHGGVLDKSAHGLIAVGLEQGCKMLPRLLHGRKKYITKCQLGIETDTYNIEGNVVEEHSYDHVQFENLKKCLRDSFTGSFNQVPPVFSALKHHGERLSDLARSGRSVPENKLLPRPVTVHSISCTHFQPPYFELDIECGSGFYVRSLVHDVGRALGTCAVVTDLQRTAHGPFQIQDAVYEWTLDNVLNAVQRSRRMFNQRYHDMRRRES